MEFPEALLHGLAVKGPVVAEADCGCGLAVGDAEGDEDEPDLFRGPEAAVRSDAEGGGSFLSSKMPGVAASCFLPPA